MGPGGKLERFTTSRAPHVLPFPSPHTSLSCPCARPLPHLHLCHQSGPAPPQPAPVPSLWTSPPARTYTCAVALDQPPPSLHLCCRSGTTPHTCTCACAVALDQPHPHACTCAVTRTSPTPPPAPVPSLWNAGPAFSPSSSSACSRMLTWLTRCEKSASVKAMAALYCLDPKAGKAGHERPRALEGQAP